MLDNYPLAIELAAGWCRTLSAREIADRLRWRPQLLRDTRASVSERHASLAAALDWSLSQLSTDSLTILQEAAIFGSDFDLLAAEAILGGAGPNAVDVLDSLDPLVEHHLINRDHYRARFRILEPIRQSLTTMAPHSEELARRHGQYYLALLADIGAGLLGPDEPIWWGRFQNDLANIRDSVNWAIAAGESAPIEAAMRWFPPTAQNLLLTQATDWAVESLNAFDVEPRELPSTALTAAMGWHRLGRLDRSEEILTDLERTEIDPSLRSMLFFVRSIQHFMAGRPSEAHEWGNRCFDAAQDDADRVMMAVGRIAQMHPEAVAAADALGTPTLRAYSRFFSFGMMDEPTKLKALGLGTAAHEAALESHNPFCIACGQTVLAAVLLRLGDLNNGASLMRQGAEAMLRYRSHFLVRHVVETVANGLAGAGVSYPAAVLWAVIDERGAGGLARNLRNPALPDKVAADLIPVDLVAAQTEGAALTVDEGAVFALEILEKLATN